LEEISYTKIMDTEDKSGLSGAVPPEAWSEWHWFVTVRFKFLNALVESNDGGLFEAVHTKSAFKIDVSTGRDGNGVSRIVPDFLQNYLREDADVLVIGHGSA
jgi:hypothetical protein